MKTKLSNQIKCYDNGGKTADRYTVAYLETKHFGLYDCVCMDEKPFHPQGVGMHGECLLGRHLGKLVAFESLPADCQKLVIQDLSDLQS